MLPKRGASTRPFILWIALCAGALGACFDPPADDVLFSCDPASSAACPADYACEMDGCCHRKGSDVEANFGACSLAGASDGGESSESGETGSTGAP